MLALLFYLSLGICSPCTAPRQVRNHCCLKLRCNVCFLNFPHPYSQFYTMLLMAKLSCSFFHSHCSSPRGRAKMEQGSFISSDMNLMQLVSYQLPVCNTVHGVDVIASPHTSGLQSTDNWLQAWLKITRLSKEVKLISYLQLVPIWLES